MSELNLILDILTIARKAKPDSVFIKSLYDQYCNRGGLSKKQLEGLYSKVLNVEGIAAGKLATLEAIIKKKPTRYKSEAPSQVSIQTRDESILPCLQAIISKYPQHKRIAFLLSKYNNNQHISISEVAEIKKLHALLIK
jgi:hypothetical protein